MNSIHLANVKKLIRKTLERRNVVSEKDLQQIPEIREQVGDNFQVVISEMVDEGQIMFMEFIHEDLPGTIHTIYFPVGTVVYEPGLSVKGRFLPDHVDEFYQRLLSKNILEKEFFDGLDYSDRMTYYEAMLDYCKDEGISFRKLDRPIIYKILQALMLKGKVIVRHESENHFGGS